MPDLKESLRLNETVVGLVLSIVYAASGYFGIRFVSLPPGNLTLIWFASGIGLIAYRILGRRAFIWVLLGSFAVNFPYILTSSRFASPLLPVIAGLLVAGIDSFQSYAAHRMAARLEGRLGHRLFSSADDILIYTAAICTLPALLTTWMLVPIPAYITGGGLTLDLLLQRTLYITVADALGLLLIGPLYWAWRFHRAAEEEGLVGRVLINLIPLLPLLISFVASPHWIWLIFPAILVTALRFSFLDANLGNLVIAVTAILGTSYGRGPFAAAETSVSFFNLTLFLVSVVFARHYALLLRNDLVDAHRQLLTQDRLAGLGQLAGGVAHELRQPLGAIKNVAYFLRTASGESEEQEVREALTILEEEVTRAERTVGDLLDFARARPPARQDVNTSSVLHAALRRVEVPPSVDIVMQLEREPPDISADPHQLNQVLENLIRNAIQAMPDGGRLTISVSSLLSEVIVSVSDTGAGIPEENLQKIFEPLFTTRAAGIGLGLVIVRTLVEGHGGTIEVESEVGAGTTFTVRLPIGVEHRE